MFEISFFFFQAEDGIRDTSVTGVQTCALPISGAGLNEVFHVFSAGYFAIGIFQMQRAAIAIRIHGMRNPHADDAALAIRRVRSEERRVGKECRAVWGRET